MYKDDYISAFGKLAPSEEWMADTLAKMRAAEAEQEAPGAAGPAGRPALRVSGKKHPRLRRAALPVAAAVALLAMVLSLLSPWLALLVALCGMAVSYTQACGLLSAVTGRSDAQLLSVKMLLVALALALTLIVGGLVGGLLMRGVTQRVMVLLNSVGSLI